MSQSQLFLALRRFIACWLRAFLAGQDARGLSFVVINNPPDCPPL